MAQSSPFDRAAGGQIVRNAASKAAVALGYPCTMALCGAVLAWTAYNGVPLAYGTYLAVTLATLAIIGNELSLPYRKQWVPRPAQVADDATFLIFVNILWPRCLAFVALLALADLNESRGWPDLQVWPRELPLAAQCALLLLIGDFGRYWLHRACHSYEFLWRFHAVHHAPKGLYTLNAGRLHPVEVALHFLVDTLPFILLGAPKSVLAFYFLFYAVNGFYKHANCRVRLGFLNWIISGPELHRWHHSLVRRESCANYGTNLIIWDRLFGTLYAPDRRGVGELGLCDRVYAGGFLRQLIAPFRVEP